MSERRESSCSESIELVSEDLDLLCLLLRDVEKLPLVCDLLDLLARVGLVVAHGVRLEAHDLHTLLDLLLQLASTSLQLLGLHTLLCDLFLELLLRFVDGLDPLLGVLLDALRLLLEALLVLFVLLLVLALDDLLRLLGHTVELHVLGSLLVVLDLQVEALLLILDLLQARRRSS